jgi:hypothetical protein
MNPSKTKDSNAVFASQPRSCSNLMVLGGLFVAFVAATVARAEDRGGSLVFNTNNYIIKTLTVSQQTIKYRAFEGMVYVAKPVEAKYQTLNLYVPEDYYEGKAIGGYTIETAPIFLPNNVGGYMPGMPSRPGGMGGPGGPGGPGGLGGPGGPGEMGNPGGPGDPGGLSANGHPQDAVAMALSKGLVVAAPGARGRTLKAADGTYTGKAPACIVDLKAAVRYLRHNRTILPGNVEKIISNGTSAGGALSALLGATGNSPDYEPYLKAIGAAEERDDIFAASCYCPITDLDHADAAYEWLFNGLNEYNNHGRSGTMSTAQIQESDLLKPLFPPYLNSLALKSADGTALSLDAKGDGSFKDYVKSLVMASAQKALAGGKDLSGLTWLTIKEGKVTDLDFARCIAYTQRMKATPAFDSLDLSTPEDNLFGSSTVNSRHFTRFAADRSADHSLAESDVVKAMNPLNYIGVSGVGTAPHWRIRHGAADRDTALAVPVILATKLQNSGYQVDFAVPWGQRHGGDYDLDELFAWINQISR